MSREDEKHTTFITVDDLFYYVSMPYGLKNVLPTFVRVMHKTFGDPIRDLIEVYVDDIIVKIESHASLLDNLVQVFDRLRSTRTKLNPDKCVSGPLRASYSIFCFPSGESRQTQKRSR
jgi:hypothetical protein